MTVHIRMLKSGKWIAATLTSPYFCVEADTEGAARKLAHDALDFYGRAIARRSA